MPGDTTADDLRAIRVDQFIAHPPAKVWRALTEPELVARWLMPNDFKPEVGHRFTFTTEPKKQVGFDGVVHCEVLEIQQERLLKISWSDGKLADWTVTWRLVPEGRGTRLFLDHEGFDPDDELQQLSRRIMGGGWRNAVFRAIAAVVDGL
ncbi:SRPBCC domain-containing protein [Nonomuraea deserti]|uniref:SRPBCC domain-containing protein n=1 Tax=Nonomuraea deserti TaxID=1848322 RepID=A0A4V6PC75_9ACTN|nr:SRPBCC domain-containing protein [Nonomuraea deserti]TDC89505.1 SRPBCC domain-containing protein [Nonomuraea deserti]